MHLTLVHPCIGRRRGQPYIRTWQMEPLAPATLAGLTPRDRDVEIRFYDDRTESIPFDEPTDLVAMSVETYTVPESNGRIASELVAVSPGRARRDGRLSSNARSGRSERVRRIN